MTTPHNTGDGAGKHTPQTSHSAGAATFQDVTVAGWGLLGAALLTLVASLLPWWTVSFSMMGISSSSSVSGWHRFWWVGLLMALAVGAVYLLRTFKVIAPDPKIPLLFVYGGLTSFLLTVFSLIDTVTLAGGGDGFSSGPSFGVFFALLTTGALAYFGALVAQESGLRLPIAVPGPQR